MPITPEFLLQTKSVWRKYSSSKLTQEDCRQVLENAAGFFGVLAEWQAAEERKHDRLSEHKSSVASQSPISCSFMGAQWKSNGK